MMRHSINNITRVILVLKFVFIFLLYSPAYSLEISKDTVLMSIRKPFISDIKDTLTIYNNSRDSLFIDSIYVQIIGADYTQIDENGMDLLLNDRYYHDMDSIGEELYRAMRFIDYAEPLRIGPGDSLVLFQIEVGNCLVCGRGPSYPTDFPIKITLYPDHGGPVSFWLVDKMESFSSDFNKTGFLYYGCQLPEKFDFSIIPDSCLNKTCNDFDLFISGKNIIEAKDVDLIFSYNKLYAQYGIYDLGTKEIHEFLDTNNFNVSSDLVIPVSGFSDSIDYSPFHL